MSPEFIRAKAKQSFTALKNPYSSVYKVFPEAIDKIKKEPFSYIGVKNRPEIPVDFLKDLEETGHYALHTLDVSSIGGRAIDTNLVNPISGRPMTGSSSGTAINVLLGINEVGIGTDGGGSVLAPAIALNLFSFISPSLCNNHTSQYEKTSTDGHTFTPSIGFITRSLKELTQIIRKTLPLKKDKISNCSIITFVEDEKTHNLPVRQIQNKSVDIYDSREALISFVKATINKGHIILTKEGPIDFEGLGDSVLGHMGKKAKDYQRKGNKGLIRVANIANAAALTVPTSDFATAYVLIGKDTPEVIENMLIIAQHLAEDPDSLLRNYFSNFDNYFADGYGL